jgi:hypothetical protein
MRRLQINLQENEQIHDILLQLLKRYQSPCDEAFLMDVRAHAAQLPPRVLLALNEFRCSDDHNGTFLLRGFSIDAAQLEPTPSLVRKEVDENSAPREGFLMILLTALLGDAFGWSSQREGALINNILPLKTHEGEQLSTGSSVDLDWHTEEAFHPYRADYLALMCLRNQDHVPTVVGSVQDVVVSERIKKTLFEPRFIFLTDKNFQNGMFEEEVATPILFGDYDSPYVKIDPSFMKAAPGDHEAAEALHEITHAFANALRDVVLQSGDVLFIDNYRVVHGRKAFRPRFDGTDRWLKRINVTSDLRKSRSMRQSHNSRVIITN